MKVFDAMSWQGEFHDGYSVLKDWSIGFDRVGENKIFLAESSIRATLYATSEYAGGEAMPAVQYCLADLRQYIDDREVRRRHRLKHLEYGIPVVRPKLTWLKAQLSALNAIEEKCRKIQKQHPFGIVYAIRFTPADCDAVQYRKSMGLMSSVPVTPDRLIGKIHVPADLEYISPGDIRKLRLHVAEPLPGIWGCARR